MWIAFKQRSCRSDSSERKGTPHTFGTRGPISDILTENRIWCNRALLRWRLPCSLGEVSFRQTITHQRLWVKCMGCFRERSPTAVRADDFPFSRIFELARQFRSPGRCATTFGSNYVILKRRMITRTDYKLNNGISKVNAVILRPSRRQIPPSGINIFR